MRWGLGVSVALTFALFAAACGSSSDGGSGGKSGTGASGGKAGSGGASKGGSGGTSTGGSGGTGAAGSGGAGTGGSGAASTGGSGGAGGSAGSAWIDPLAGIGNVESVASGYQFLEGPVWFSALGVLRFSDINGAKIYELAPPSSVTLFRDPSNGANGLGIDQNGLLVVCEQTTRQVTRTLANGQSQVLASKWQNVAFNSPNDVVVAKDGTIYFTDPPYGGNPNDLGFQGVFRIDPGGVLHLESQDMFRPNGVALSPDGKTLYVDDSEQNYLRRYDVASDGSASNPQKLTDTSPTPDGMGMDVQGDLFVSTSAGIEVYLADGTLHGTIAVPEQPANCTFGGSDGKTLYITARTGLYRVTLAVAGLP